MKKTEMSKKLTWTILIFFFVMILATYVANLCFGRDITGLEYILDYLFWLTLTFCLVYLPKSLVENIFKYNVFSFMKKKTVEVNDVVEENDVNNSGGEV